MLAAKKAWGLDYSSWQENTDPCDGWEGIKRDADNRVTYLYSLSLPLSVIVLYGTTLFDKNLIITHKLTRDAPSIVSKSIMVNSETYLNEITSKILESLDLWPHIYHLWHNVERHIPSIGMIYHVHYQIYAKRHLSIVTKLH